MFRAQFEEAGGRILFRYGKGRAPVVVTVDEMKESVEAYRRCIGWVTKVASAALIVAILGFILSGSTFLERDGTIWLLILVWAVPFVLAFKWAWKSPTKQFARRTPVGAERTRAEVRARMLSEWGWQRTALLPVGAGLALVVYQIANWPPVTIESWIWLGFGVFFLVTGFFNSIIKWRAEQA